jgi:hypothetical protein
MAAVASAARPPTPTPATPARLGSLWSTLEDQRGAAVPLLSSAWTLPTTSQDGEQQQPKEGLLRRAGAAVARWWGAACGAVAELWTFARADPRKPVFAGKVALALALISLLVFLREPRDIVSHSIWAILTVVVVFEFSIGARRLFLLLWVYLVQFKVSSLLWSLYCSVLIEIPSFVKSLACLHLLLGSLCCPCLCSNTSVLGAWPYIVLLPMFL